MSSSCDKLQLYLAHRAALVEYCAPIVGCRSQAEDIVQEAWLRFCAHPDAQLHQPLGYLYRIVRNLSLDQQRHHQISAQAPEGNELLDTLESETASPEESVIQQGQLACLQQALEKLPLRSQQAFIMHRLHGLTFQQIAQQLGISSSLAHQLVRDALAFCAQQLHRD